MILLLASIPKNCEQPITPPINAGTIPINTQVESLRYTFKGAILEDFNYNTSIGEVKLLEHHFQ